MSNPDDERKRQELLRTLAETKEIAPMLITKGRNLTEAGQSALDWALTVESLASKIADHFFQHPTVANISSAFREFNGVAWKQHEQITGDADLLRIFHATTTTTSVTTSAIAFGSPRSEAETIPEWKSMNALLHRSIDVTKIIESMMDLGLDATHGDAHSPVELVRTAEEALKRPFANEGYAIAVLVPLRESIQGCIDELLKRRPILEKTSSWTKKVESIARHCGQAVMSSDHVNRVAVTTHTLINELSSSKQRPMNRDLIANLFDQGVSLLQDIVALVDRQKLRTATK